MDAEIKRKYDMLKKKLERSNEVWIKNQQQQKQASGSGEKPNWLNPDGSIDRDKLEDCHGPIERKTNSMRLEYEDICAKYGVPPANT